MGGGEYSTAIDVVLLLLILPLPVSGCTSDLPCTTTFTGDERYCLQDVSIPPPKAPPRESGHEPSSVFAAQLTPVPGDPADAPPNFAPAPAAARRPHQLEAFAHRQRFFVGVVGLDESTRSRRSVRRFRFRLDVFGIGENADETDARILLAAVVAHTRQQSEYDD